MILRKIKTFFKSPGKAISSLRKSFRQKVRHFCLKETVYRWLPDKLALKLKFEWLVGEPLDLRHPTTYNQKLQWLKLHDRNPLYTKLADKAEVKQYVAETIGREYVIPTYGVWDCAEAIEWEVLPEQFAIKCTHDSGSVVICRSKRQLDQTAVAEKLKKCLSKSQFQYGREWPYKKIKPRIIAEQLLTDGSDQAINDYKALCFHGEPKLVQIHHGRGTSEYTQDYYDPDWNLTSISQKGYPISSRAMPKPAGLERMLALSRILSKGIPHVRIDWYFVNGNVYFGEFTFYDGSGMCAFDHREDDELLGSWIQLKTDKKQKDK